MQCIKNFSLCFIEGFKEKGFRKKYIPEVQKLLQKLPLKISSWFLVLCYIFNNKKGFNDMITI